MVPKKHKQSGVTLIELIIGLVIISVALAAMAAAVSSMAGRSSDPAVRQQAIAIANMYMAEVASKEFTDTACPAVPSPGGRSNFTHVCHYNGWNDTVAGGGARDQLGTAIAGLSAYAIKVDVVDAGRDTVDNNPVGDLGVSGSQIPIGDVLKITVTVTGPSNTSFAVTSYRTRYGGS